MEDDRNQYSCTNVLLGVFCLALQCGGLVLLIVGLVQENGMWISGLCMSLVLPLMAFFTVCLTVLEKNCPRIHFCVLYYCSILWGCELDDEEDETRAQE